MCPIQLTEDAAEFDVEAHVEDLVAFFVVCGLTTPQIFDCLEEMILDALGANAVRHWMVDGWDRWIFDLVMLAVILLAFLFSIAAYETKFPKDDDDAG